MAPPLCWAAAASTFASCTAHLNPVRALSTRASCRNFDALSSLVLSRTCSTAACRQVAKAAHRVGLHQCCTVLIARAAAPVSSMRRYVTRWCSTCTTINQTTHCLRMVTALAWAVMFHRVLSVKESTVSLHNHHAAAPVCKGGKVRECTSRVYTYPMPVCLFLCYCPPFLEGTPGGHRQQPPQEVCSPCQHVCLLLPGPQVGPQPLGAEPKDHTLNIGIATHREQADSAA